MTQFKPYKLGELIDIQNGYAFKSEDLKTTGIPIIKIKNIQPPNIAFNEADYYPHELNERLKQFLAKKKDILISMTGSHVSQIASAVGKVGRYGFDKPALINQRVGKLYSKDIKKLNNDYLYYFIARQEIQFELATNAGGSANQANISPQDIKELEIDLPDIQSQTLIASILSSLDDKIELNRRTNKTLEQIAQTLFKKYFVDDIDPENLPEGWKLGKLEDVTTRITKGTTPTTLKKQFVLSGINFLKVENLTEIGTFDRSKMNFIDEETNKLLSRSQIENKDILFSIAGTLGRMALVEEAILPANTNQALAIIRPDLNVIEPLYLFYWLKQPEVREAIFSKSVQGVQANLSLGVLSDTDIIIPAKKYLINKFESINSIYKQIELKENEIITLIKIRDSLLPKLMSGEIEVNAIENELAEA